MIVELKHLQAVKVKEPEKWLPFIRETCEKYQINTDRRIASFLAQTAHESGGYTMLEENLNYSDATMAAVWPNRFAVIDPATKKPKKDEKGKNIPNAFAKALHRKPEAIANAVYSNRMGNGTIESGEGWKHRGMGLKQLTGKDNHKRCGDALGADFVTSPELLLDPKWAALSAGWFYSVNRLADFADKDDLKGMTIKINGGLIGFEDREKRYKAAKESMDS